MELSEYTGVLRGELRFIKGSHDDLVAILHAPPVQRDLRCGPLTYPNYRLVPDSRWLLDLPARRVGARSARRRKRGVAMFVLGTKELKRYGFAAGASPSTNVPDPGFVPIARNARLIVSWESETPNSRCAHWQRSTIRQRTTP
jgi:hypothetical protein